MNESAIPEDGLTAVKRRVQEFAGKRDWDQFHSPKNLAMALIGEAGEFVEHFQWLSKAGSAVLPAEKLEAVKLELADVLIYLIRLADKLDIDLAAAAHYKITLNDRK